MMNKNLENYVLKVPDVLDDNLCKIILDELQSAHWKINTFYNHKNKTNDVWKQTSYNTLSGVHKLGGTPFRKNYAGMGYSYDEDRDAFIPPQRYKGWVLNETTCQWEAPISYPETTTQNLTDEDGNPTNDIYYWNEELLDWKL